MSRIVILGLVALLTACGGDNPTVGGGSGLRPPPQTTIQARNDRILALNPTLLASDTLERTALTGSRPSERTAPFTCSAGRCIHPFFEGSQPIADMFDTELVEEIGTHRGIVVGRFEKSEPETDETYG